jgi:hypothetical protein
MLITTEKCASHGGARELKAAALVYLPKPPYPLLLVINVHYYWWKPAGERKPQGSLDRHHDSARGDDPRLCHEGRCNLTHNSVCAVA